MRLLPLANMRLMSRTSIERIKSNKTAIVVRKYVKNDTSSDVFLFINLNICGNPEAIRIGVAKI